MAKKVLIIDDDSGAAESMAELCRRIDLEPVVVTSPKEAAARFGAEKPDLLVLDLLLPGTDGMKLGAELRKLPGGAAVPILAVSGVFKQSNVARDLWQTLQAEYLPKPFDASAFQAAVRRRLGIEEHPEPTRTPRRAPPRRVELQPFATDLRKEPAYRLLVRLYEARASGHLDLTRGKVRRRLTFHAGHVRYAASNASQENVGGMQVARGELDEAAFRAAVEAARSRRIPLSEALVATGAMDRASLGRALAEQVREIAIQCIGWADGEARFTPDPQGAVAMPEHRVHPLAVVVEGMRRFYAPETIGAFLEGRKAAYLHPTELMTREQYTLRGTTPGERITLLVDGSRTLAEVLAAARPEDLPLLFGLVTTGLARMQRAPLSQGAPGAAAAAPPPVQAHARATPAPMAAAAPATISDAGRTFTPEEEAARARIAEEHARIAEATHYEVLGVGASADEATVQKAYVALAREWHTDRFAGLNLGSAAPRLEEIFQRIGEARTVLTDPEQRKEYAVYLDRKAKGLPTDVGAILKAEELFQSAERLVKAGRGKEALATLEEAIALNHTEAEFFAWRGYARVLAEGEEAAEAARADIDHALAADAEMPAAHYFLGMMALRGGDVEGAARRFARVLDREPTHAEAQQQLRLLRMRQEKEKGGGIFKKMLKR